MKTKKRTLTLLEIMIVIALITLITGVIGYNMRDSLNRGRAFRTEQAKEQLRDMLLLCVSDGKSPAQVQHTPKACVKTLGLAKNVDQLFKDGWGGDFKITYVEDEGDFKIESDAYTKYLAKKG